MLATQTVAQLSVVSAAVLLTISLITIFLTAQEINEVYNEALRELDEWKVRCLPVYVFVLLVLGHRHRDCHLTSESSWIHLFNGLVLSTDCNCFRRKDLSESLLLYIW